MRENEYEVVDYREKHEVIARFWWDGKQVRSDNAKMLKVLKDGDTYGNRFENSKDWLENLPRIFRSGYRTARRAKNGK